MLKIKVAKKADSRLVLFVSILYYINYFTIIRVIKSPEVMLLPGYDRMKRMYMYVTHQTVVNSINIYIEFCT